MTTSSVVRVVVGGHEGLPFVGVELTGAAVASTTAPIYLRLVSPQVIRTQEAACRKPPVEQRVGHREFAHPANELRDGVLIDRHLAVTVEQLVEVSVG